MSDDEKTSENSNIKLAQVTAAALAAVTAAFLGSSLGVYGTVLGAGLMSVLTTVGSELYLRSMRRTKEAAQRTKDAAKAKVDPRGRPTRMAAPVAPADQRPATRQVPGQHSAGYRTSATRTHTFRPVSATAQSPKQQSTGVSNQRAQQGTQRLPVAGNGRSGGGERTVLIPTPGSHQPTTSINGTEPPEVGAHEKSGLGWGKKRWWWVIGTSLGGFVICMLAIFGFEAITGSAISGGEGSTIGQVVGGAPQPASETTDEGGVDDSTPPGTNTPAPSTSSERGGNGSEPTKTSSPAEPSNEPAPSNQRPAPSKTSSAETVPDSGSDAQRDRKPEGGGGNQLSGGSADE